MGRRKYLLWAAALGVTAISAPVSAVSIDPVFTVTTPYSLYDVELGAKFNPSSGYIAQTSYGYAAPGGLSMFQHRDPGFLAPVLSIAMAGLTDLGTPGSSHVFVGLNTTAAAALVGQSFEQAFGYDESHIAAALAGASSSTNGNSIPYIDELTAFNRALRNGNYYASADPGLLTLVSFTSGQVIGSVALTDAAGPVPNVASPAPEPSTWAMMIVGFGIAGVGLRRRRIASSYA